MPGGRPPKLTKSLQNTLVKAFEAGHYVEDACAIAGIHKQSYYNWMTRGENGNRENRLDRPYCEFFDAVKKAQTGDKHLAHIADNGNWQARAWVLERRQPEKWALSSRLQQAVRKMRREEWDFVLEHVSPETQRELFPLLSILGYPIREDGGEASAKTPPAE